MDALFMAAGRGSRLGNLTDNIPKSLLNLNDNLSLLEYNINMLTRLGVKTIHIVTGYKTELIEKKTEKYSNVNIIFNPFWDNCNVLGSLYIALDHLKDDFFFLHADTIASDEIWNQLAVQPGEIVLPYERHSCGEEEMKVIIDSTGKITGISKLIDSDVAAGEFLGIAKFSANTVQIIKETAKNLFSTVGLDLYMEAALQAFIDNGKVNLTSLDITGHKWIEVDFLEDYENAVKIFGSQ